MYYFLGWFFALFDYYEGHDRVPIRRLMDFSIVVVHIFGFVVPELFAQ